MRWLAVGGIAAVIFGLTSRRWGLVILGVVLMWFARIEVAELGAGARRLVLPEGSGQIGPTPRPDALQIGGNQTQTGALATGAGVVAGCD